MKVLHVTNYFRGFHNHIGGAEQACYRTALMTLKHGHDVVIVTKRFDKSHDSQDFKIYPLSVLEDYLPQSIEKYIEAVKWYSLQYDFLAKTTFAKLLKKELPDIVHLHNFQFLTFSLVREAHKRGIPMCISIYDYWHFCPKAMLLRSDNSFCIDAHGVQCLQCLPKQFQLIQKPLLKMRRHLFDRVFKMIDYFIVLSEHSAGVLKGYGITANKIRVIPLTLPIEYQNTETQEIERLPENSILFAGWLNDRKGVHIAIEAMPIILNAFPDARLYVIGGRAKFADEYERRFEAFIKENDLIDKVVFLGHQSPEIVKTYLQKTSVLIIPEQYENMSPLIMIEAMILGKPIVASNLGGIPEYIKGGETGLLANAYSPEEFAEQIVTLLKDKIFAKRLGENAQKMILRRNNNDSIWQLTEGLYKDMLL
ncbi:MAG TPA: glycosyltransferase family 4 protein [Nitrospirae bacterium]|nr:glycosyltransferase family 4 protein [Nitrospirota bacterium]